MTSGKIQSEQRQSGVPETLPSWKWDVVIVGAGLASGLTALSILARVPDCKLLIVERASHLPRNHTWCFHGRDLPSTTLEWIQPVISAEWSKYEVKFPDYYRLLDSRYACISGERFYDHLEAMISASPHARILLDSNVQDIEPHQITLSSGIVCHSDWVVSARGSAARATSAQSAEKTGYQKFYGIEFELDEPHQLTHPTVMDAEVPQDDGLRFFYVLPLTPTRLLVEDTYFSDSAYLNASLVRERVVSYAQAKQWSGTVVREEQGVLPLPWLNYRVEPPQDGLITIGYAAHHFHPITGYSLPIALRVAEIVGLELGAGRSPVSKINTYHRALARQLKMITPLNRVLFGHYLPEERWRLMRRFYRRREDTIERFYSLELSLIDLFLILAGPIPDSMRWWPRARSELLLARSFRLNSPHQTLSEAHQVEGETT